MATSPQAPQDPDIHNRFAYHAPDTARAAMHEDVRWRFESIAQWAAYALPDGREKALVITKLEEAMFWANATIARQGTV